jgi:hypothetical protein
MCWGMSRLRYHAPPYVMTVTGPELGSRAEGRQENGSCRA